MLSITTHLEDKVIFRERAIKHDSSTSFRLQRKIKIFTVL